MWQPSTEGGGGPTNHQSSRVSLRFGLEKFVAPTFDCPSPHTHDERERYVDQLVG